MLYRTLGRTGLKASQLGFGAMRLPMKGEGAAARVDDDLAVPMIHAAFQAGVNYIDTAVMYCNSDSQRAVGVALKGWREKIIVSTKNPYFGQSEKEWWNHLEKSLHNLNIGQIDIYKYHGVNWTGYCENVKPRVSRWMHKAHEQGLIKHVCCSFHDNCEALIKLVDEDFVDVITLQYNLLDRQLEPGIAHAHEKGIGVVVMGPVGGGRLAEPSEVLASLLPEVKRVPELALRFVLANPNVSVCLSGMSTLAQVQENIKIASDPVSLTAEHSQAIDDHLERLKKMAELYCTGCRYCLPCPHDIDIPSIFEKYNRGRVYGLWDSAREAYARMGEVPWDKGQKADACERCHECESKCPQGIKICDQLMEAHLALTQSGEFAPQ